MTMTKITGLKKPGKRKGLLRKLERLLDMEYTPAEMAEELDMDKKQVWRMITEKGAPARQAANNRYWIHGLTFAKWVNSFVEASRVKPPKMAANEFFCVTCRKRVIVPPDSIGVDKESAIFLLFSSSCPSCGKAVRKVNRKPRR